MFDSQTLKKFEFLSIASNQAFAGQTSGTRRNAQLYGGSEFADYRDYVFGDDLRNLDWNVYARFETLYIKRFQEEGDVPVYLFLDVSSSMGSTSDAKKFEYARNVAGALGYISLARFDSVAAATFTDRIEEFFPLVRGKERFLSLASFLEEAAPRERETDASAAIRDGLARIGKPGLAVIITDGFDRRGLDAGLERLLARRFEPLVLQLYTPEEASPRETGDFVFIDAETGVRQKFTVDEAALRRYRKRFERLLADTRSSCVKRGVRHYATSIERPFDAFLLDVARDLKSGR